jgi:hypothetical protein
MRRHNFHLLAVSVEINPKKPRDVKVDFICQEDAFHFMMSRATLETLQAHIAEAMTKAPVHAARRGAASTQST